MAVPVDAVVIDLGDCCCVLIETESVLRVCPDGIPGLLYFFVEDLTLNTPWYDAQAKGSPCGADWPNNDGALLAIGETYPMTYNPGTGRWSSGIVIVQASSLPYPPDGSAEVAIEIEMRCVDTGPGTSAMRVDIRVYQTMRYWQTTGPGACLDSALILTTAGLTNYVATPDDCAPFLLVVDEDLDDVGSTNYMHITGSISS